MSLDLDVVGRRWDAGDHAWTSKDAILYALGVGAGAGDPLAELPFTTENSHQIVQQVLPTFVATFGADAGPKLGDFDLSQVLHGEQAVEVFEPLPTDGRARIATVVTGIYDKGAAALAVLESSIADTGTGRLIARTRSGVFIRGEGGFGGARGDSAPWVPPDRSADQIIVYPTRADQALLYRLSGDRNPLHSDPWLASRAGFDRPILHGMCSYGFTGRALLHALCGSDPAAFGSMSARFAATVVPGQEFSVHIWDDGEVCRFVTKVGETVVLDRGVFTRRSS
jgi:acyl dehydratase